MLRLAAIFPHPDDESLFAAGLLAGAVRAGATVQVLCLTRGEAGWSRFGEHGEALATRRTAELQSACEALDTAPPEVWAWPDGALCERADERAVPSLGEWLTRRAPHVVVSFGADGAYGHADHVQCAAWVQAAVGRHVHGTRLLQAVFEPETFTGLRRRLQRFAPALLLAEPPSSPQNQAPEVVLNLDDTDRALKRQAIAAHASQLPGGDVDRFLAPGLVSALCLRERFRIAAGPALAATTDDPFEGLAP